MSGSARALAYAVHALTASGVVVALAAMLEVASETPDPRRVLAWLGLAIAIDAIDGPLARAAVIERNAPAIDGRTIDDIVDYLTYTFIPLALVLRMGWTAGPAWLAASAVGLAMVTSLFGFAHRAAKDEQAGFFRGFPSYWNLAAYYFGLWASLYDTAGRVAVTVALLVLAVSTVLPVRFVYPNRARPPWRRPILLGAVGWGVLLAVSLPWYPRPGETGGIAPAAMWLSLSYPLFYCAVSVRLDRG